MSTRKLLLILVPAAALLIFALLHMLRDGESVAGPPLGRVLGEARLPGAASANLPAVGEGGVPRVEPLPVEEGEAAAVATAPPAPVRGSVSGRVVDGAGQPVAGEPVFLTLDRDAWEPHVNPHDEDEDQPDLVVGSGVTDEQGAFSFVARAGVRHVLHAGGAKWPRLAMDHVHAGDHLQVVLPDGFVLTGTVLEAESRTPIGGAHVLALTEDDQILGLTGPDGGFSLGPLPAQDVTLGGYAPGFDIAVLGEIAPALGPVTLELAPGREVRGRVVDRDTGEALTAGGEVRLQLDVLATLGRSEDKLPARRTVEEQTTAIDASGLFAFASGPSFGFSLLVSAPGYAPLVFDRYEERSIEGDEEIVIYLRPLVPLAGSVVSAEDGSPVADAQVSAAGPHGEFATATSGADGSFTLDRASWDGHGPVFVAAADAGGRSARVHVDDPHEPLLLQLVPALAVTVQVMQGGAAVPGAEVAALSQGSEPSQASTGPDGTATLSHPLAGPDVSAVRLQARHADSQSLPLVVDPHQPHDDKLVLDLLGGGEVTGVVVEQNGEPVPSALLRLQPDPDLTPDLPQQLVLLGYVEESVDADAFGKVAPLVAHADLLGAFRIAAVLPDVAYRLRASAPGFRDATLSPVWADGAPLTVTLDPVVLWEGRLLDATSGLAVPQFIGQLLLDKAGGKSGGFQPTKQRVVRKPDAPGEFYVELAEPGRYQLRMQAQDMIAALSAPVDFDGKQAPPYAALVMWPAAVLEVAVLDGRGRPVPGYAVVVIPWEVAEKAETPSGEVRKLGQVLRTGSDGLARFNLGEGGGYRVGGGPGLWLDPLAVLVKPGAPVSRVYHLPPTGDLEVKVSDDLGRPLAGVRVDVRSAKSEKAHSIARQAATHGVDGIVRIEALLPGVYDVTLRRRNYELQRLPVTIHGNAIERLAVTLQPKVKEPAGETKGVLFGQPKDGGGKPR